MTNKQRRRLISIYCRKNYINLSICKKHNKYRKLGYDYYVSPNWGLYYKNAMNMFKLSWDREILYAVMMAGGKKCLQQLQYFSLCL